MGTVSTSNLVAEYVAAVANTTNTAPHTNSDGDKVTWYTPLNTIDGTVTNVTAWDATEGWNGSGSNSEPYCLRLGGTNGHFVTVPNSSDLYVVSDMSGEVWFKPSGTSVPTQFERIYYYYQNSSNKICLVWDSTNEYLYIYVRRSGVDYYVRWNITIDADTIHHIVWTFNSSNNWVLYHDGQEVSQTTGMTFTYPTTPSTGLWLGGRGDSTLPFKGDIYTVRKYNKILTSTEVYDNYTTGANASSLLYIPDFINMTGSIYESTIDVGNVTIDNISSISSTCSVYESSLTISSDIAPSQIIGQGSIYDPLIYAGITISTSSINSDISVYEPGIELSLDQSNSISTTGIIYTPDISSSITLIPDFTQLGLKLHYHAGLARLGTDVNDNNDVDNRGTWTELVNGRDGTLENVAYTTSSGWSGNGLTTPAAFTSDGTSDKVTVAATSETDLTDDFSVEMWVKANSIVVNARLIEKNNQWQMIIGTGGKIVFGLKVDGTWRYFYTPTYVLQSGATTQLAFTYRVGSGGKWYVNGIQDGSGYITSTIGSASTTSDVMTIGSNASNTSSFPGSLMIARIYSTDLSSSEVQQNYIAGPFWTHNADVSPNIINATSTFYTTPAGQGAFNIAPSRILSTSVVNTIYNSMGYTFESISSTCVIYNPIISYDMIISPNITLGAFTTNDINYTQNSESSPNMISGLISVSPPDIEYSGNLDILNLNILATCQLYPPTIEYSCDLTSSSVQCSCSIYEPNPGVTINVAADIIEITTTIYDVTSSKTISDQIGIELPSNDPFTSTWKDLVRSHDGTLTNISGTESSGWGGTNTVDDPLYLAFDGDDDIVVITNASDLNFSNNSFTIEAFIKISDYDSNRSYIIDYRGGNAGYALFVNESSDNKLYFETGNGSTYTNISSDYALTSDRWYHIAGTYDGITMRLYVDGKEQLDTANPSEGVANNNTNNYILGSNLYGKINTVRLYSRCLNTSSIIQNLNAGLIERSNINILQSSIILTTAGFYNPLLQRIGYDYLLDGGKSDTLNQVIIDCGNSLREITSALNTYTIPNNHIISIGSSKLCNVACNYKFEGRSVIANLDEVSDIDTVFNFDGNYGKIISNSKIQINLADESGIFYENNWQDLTQSQYYFSKIKFRAVLNSIDDNITPMLVDMKIMVDVPDMQQSNTVMNVPTSGAQITYPIPYQSVASNFFSANQWNIIPQSARFSGDGTKLWVLDKDAESILGTTLTTPYLVHTDKFTNSYKFSNQNISPISFDVAMSGLRYWILDSTTASIYQYSTSIAWNTASSIYNGKYFNVGLQDSSPQSILVDSLGQYLYMVGDDTDTLYQYELSTNYDIISASYTGLYLPITPGGLGDINPTEFYIDPYNVNIYILASSTNTIYQYVLSDPADISSAEYIQSLYIGGYDTLPRSITFSPDGYNLYIVGKDTNVIYQLQMNSPWDISTAVFNDTPIVNPNIQVTILNPQPGDMAVISDAYNTGFTVQILNNGSGVSRNINWCALGY